MRLARSTWARARLESIWTRSGKVLGSLAVASISTDHFVVCPLRLWHVHLFATAIQSPKSTPQRFAAFPPAVRDRRILSQISSASSMRPVASQTQVATIMLLSLLQPGSPDRAFSLSIVQHPTLRNIGQAHTVRPSDGAIVALRPRLASLLLEDSQVHASHDDSQHPNQNCRSDNRQLLSANVVVDSPLFF